MIHFSLFILCHLFTRFVPSHTFPALNRRMSPFLMLAMAVKKYHSQMYEIHDVNHLLFMYVSLQACSMAYDPLQSLVAVGMQSGCVLVYGRPDVEVRITLPKAPKVTNLKFAVNKVYIYILYYICVCVSYFVCTLRTQACIRCKFMSTPTHDCKHTRRGSYCARVRTAPCMPWICAKCLRGSLPPSS